MLFLPPRFVPYDQRKWKVGKTPIWVIEKGFEVKEEGKIRGLKIYESFNCLKFCISKLPRPAEKHDDDWVVFFTQGEFDWIQGARLTEDEFTFLWTCKKNDHTYQLIPDSELEEAKNLAEGYVPKILAGIEANMLKSKPKWEAKDELPKTEEIRSAPPGAPEGSDAGNRT